MLLTELLIEMNIPELQTLTHRAKSILKQYNLNFIVTNHVGMERLLTDKSRNDINVPVILDSIYKFIEKYNGKLSHFKASKKEIEGVITNHSNNLNLVFSIDYHKPPTINPMSGVTQYNFKLITAIIKDDFKSDNFPSSVKFHIS